MQRTLRSFAGAAVVLACGVFGFEARGLAQTQNDNGRPGHWLPPVDHGDHLVGCPVVPPAQPPRFIPVHGGLIPVGPYQGWVLVWEKGEHQPCQLQYGSPGSDVDVRWALLNPRTTPPTLHKFAWRLAGSDMPAQPCGSLVPGYQGLFCAGHCWLPDGRLLVVGGDYWAQATCTPLSPAPAPPLSALPAFAGSRLVCVFDPRDIVLGQSYQNMNGPGPGSPWTCLSGSNILPADRVSLAIPRWYPTVTLVVPANLSTANPIVYISIAGGFEKLHDGISPASLGDPAFNTHEVLRFNLNTGAITRDPNFSATLPGMIPGLFTGPTTPSAGALSFWQYPRMHFVSGLTPSWPNGRLSMATHVTQWAHADIIPPSNPEAWTNGSTLSIGAGNTLLDEATCVLFPPITPAYRDVQFVMGGLETDATHAGGFANVTNKCYFLDTRAATPTWVGPVFSMWHPRKFHNVVIAPDASVVVIGGGIHWEHGAAGYGQREPEMFYNGAWFRLSNQFSERTYHSWAFALDDGRMISGGGDHCADSAEYEIFEPPNIQGSPGRPAFLASPPATIQYGQRYTLSVSAPFGQKVERVVLLNPGMVTHGHDPNQRYEPLTIVPNPNPGDDDDGAAVTVLAPANPTLMPPGYRMMFLISSAGVPSLAQWVLLLP